MTSVQKPRIQAVSLSLLYPDQPLLRDLAEGSQAALRFFSVPPRLPYAAAAQAEGALPVGVAQSILFYQQHLEGDTQSQENAAALVAGNATCILTGQQAGLLGGPVYTAYKIATAIRLARQESERSGRRCVPVFWLASEDHDLVEANHTFGTKSDGEIGRVSFRCGRDGRELSALPVDDQVTDSVERYFATLLPGGDQNRARAPYAIDGEETFATWVARSWMRLFAGTGLVIVEPALLRPACGELFQRALQQRVAISEALSFVASELRVAGYRATLDPKTAGIPFRISPDGIRTRVAEGADLASEGVIDPTALSTDAALRPVFADALLPNLAHVVGTGELAYHAMLKPLYGLFGVAQPPVLPRRSLTFITEEEAETLSRYGLTTEEALAGEVNPPTVTDRILEDGETAEFTRVAAQIRSAFQPLADSVSAVDPALLHAWQRSRDHALHSLERLRVLTGRALLARRGYSRAVLHRLFNQILPRGRPQERVFPVTYFLSRFGAPFLKACLIDEPVAPFTHEVVTLPAAPVSR